METTIPRLSPSCRQPVMLTSQPSMTGSVATSISRSSTSEWGDPGSGGGGGTEEQKPLTTLLSLKPLPHDATTQLPQSGTSGAIPVHQVRHQVQVQAPALSLR